MIHNVETSSGIVRCDRNSFTVFAAVPIA